VAAIDEGRLAGFLAAWLLPAFRGRRAVFSPEWANAARAENSRRIYEEMYTQFSASWAEDGLCWPNMLIREVSLKQLWVETP
jgi:hypothetical protein